MKNFKKYNDVYIYKNVTEKQQYKVVIMDDSIFHFASFYTIEQFKNFLKIFNIKIKYINTLNAGTSTKNI